MRSKETIQIYHKAKEREYKMGAFYLDIKKDLLDKILSGVYPQGSIIPNEYELAEIYKVSRPTIRKAVQILVGEGYLEKRKKRGTIVCDPTIRQEFAQIRPPMKENTNMKTRMTRPVTAMRLRMKRLATSIPGERTLTRRSSFREYCS